MGGAYSLVTIIDGNLPSVVSACLWGGLVALTLATCVVALATPHYKFYVLAAFSALLPMVLSWLVVYAHATANDRTAVLAPTYAMMAIVLVAAGVLSTIGAVIETKRVFFPRRIAVR